MCDHPLNLASIRPLAAAANALRQVMAGLRRDILAEVAGQANLVTEVASREEQARPVAVAVRSSVRVEVSGNRIPETKDQSIAGLICFGRSIDCNAHLGMRLQSTPANAISL